MYDELNFLIVWRKRAILLFSVSAKVVLFKYLHNNEISIDEWKLVSYLHDVCENIFKIA
jgi:hypothetical protein